MPDDAARSRSRLKVLLAALVAVAAIAGIAGVVGLLSPAGGRREAARSEGTASFTPSPAPEPPVSTAPSPEDAGAPAFDAKALRARLDEYLSSYGDVEVEVLPVGDDGMPRGSRFVDRIAPGTRFLAASGEQRPPVYAEAVVTRPNGSRFAVFLEFTVGANGDGGWSDLLTTAIP